MAEDLFFDAIKEEVEANVYTHCFVSPAVHIFTSDLRGNEAPDIYGLTPLPSHLKDKVRYETLLVLRAAEILDIFSALDLPWLIENPSESKPDLFAIPELVKILNSRPGVVCTKFGHCPDARHTTGVTRILGRTHSKNYFLSGPGENCAESCVHWANAIAQALRAESPGEPPEPDNLAEISGDFCRPAIKYTTRLRGVQLNAKELRAQEDKMALAGVRNAAEAITRLPGHIELGKILAKFFINSLRHNPRLRDLLITLGSGGVDPDELPKLSAELDQLIIPARENLAKILSCTDTSSVNNNHCTTDIRANLLHRWADAARDPGAEVCEWLKSGANAGLTADPYGIDGIFPRAGDEDEPDANFDDDFTAHSCAANDEEAAKQIRQYADRGWLEETSYAKLKKEFGNDYTVSDFCVVVKEKQGRVKRRLILDLKRSGISKRTRKTHRVVLPRLSDLVSDVLRLLSTRTENQGVEILVLDFTDAYWQIPLAVQERRHFVGYDGQKLWLYKRSAQGSRNGPLSWAGPSSLLIRCTQSVFSGMSASVKCPEARTQLYVDDPAITIRGTQNYRDDALATAVLIWRILGFPLAFQKAQRGTTVVWIGGLVEILSDRVVVSIPPEKLSEFLEIVTDMLKSNVVVVRKLRKLAGKASHFASMIYVWRPFPFGVVGCSPRGRKSTRTGPCTKRMRLDSSN